MGCKSCGDNNKDKIKINVNSDTFIIRMLFFIVTVISLPFIMIFMVPLLFNVFFFDKGMDIDSMLNKAISIFDKSETEETVEHEVEDLSDKKSGE